MSTINSDDFRKRYCANHPNWRGGIFDKKQRKKMYIENAYLGKNPKWLYLFPILGFFGLVGLEALASFLLNINSAEIIQKSVAQKGELRFFAEMMIPFAIFFVLLLLWVRYIHGQPLVAFNTSRSKIDWKRFFFSFFVWGGLMTVITFSDYLLNPENFVWNFQPERFLTLAVLAIIFIPFQAGFEEYFFRGYLMQGLGIFVKNRWFPLIFTSITFGLMHISNPEVAKLGYGAMIYYIGTGLFLGIITLMDEGIELALGFHIANNIFTALLVTTDWSVFQVPAILKDISDPSLGIEVAVMLLVFVVLFFIFRKIYGWQNWKQKLLGKVLSEKDFLEKQKNF